MKAEILAHNQLQVQRCYADNDQLGIAAEQILTAFLKSSTEPTPTHRLSNAQSCALHQAHL